MSPMILNRPSDGPAMGLSPTQEHAFAQFPSQSSLLDSNRHGYPASHNSMLANGSAQPIFNSGTASIATAPRPSRKRSRDDGSFGEALAVPAPKPAPSPKVEPIYGEGMVLLNPQTGMALSPESQTGTWYEETAEAQAAKATPVSSDALQIDAADISRKAQRLDTSAPGLDDIALSSNQHRLNGSEADQHRNLTGGSTPPAEPLIDDATHLLGISWQRMDTDNDMAPAVRGWIKYIDNQYAAYLHNSQMLMKSRALNAYLVAATPVAAFSPAFYLFNEDLTQAQLVASSWESCLRNLRNTPIIFEGAPIVASSRSNTPPSADPFNNGEIGVPLLQQALSTHSHTPSAMGAEPNEGVDMGMEIDS
ncbi:hypothetical protein N7520_007846 [Penicillium odoratum]|uniref:uncharacterized protein n=1 Tax=Penicillium odoratum TaxID=1167516 RepID=UPI00254839BC|nr:uncharacterized protein N7520_007846 [Penicillium odoratum]KAJ5760690.1 hypothetical protein N7520_007846 [Penicillium odoratum]